MKINTRNDYSNVNIKGEFSVSFDTLNIDLREVCNTD